MLRACYFLGFLINKVVRCRQDRYQQLARIRITGFVLLCDGKCWHKHV